MSSAHERELGRALDAVLQRLDAEPGLDVDRALEEMGCSESVAREARRLLKGEEELGSFLGRPALGSMPGTVQRELLADGTASSVLEKERTARFGPYVPQRLLGEGGMGRVYLASASEGAQVAVKVLRRRFRGPQARRQFAEERRALERLDHAHIARLDGAGETDDGRPYVVMEYVDGTTLVEFCDARRLGIEERLQLMIDVCHGVEHAHRRGVLHRDLKPSNILVTTVDGRAVPKIIDFGIAQALDASETPQGLGRRLGTPDYMSPEALAGETLDIRSDVYSLGVMLYELLCGKKPFPKDGSLDPEVLLRTRRRPIPPMGERLQNLPSKTAHRVAERRSLPLDPLVTKLNTVSAPVLHALALNRTDRTSNVATLAVGLQDL